eukprot:COSAG06_NODE_47176_length_341_cov_0.644628_1_plen_109_part_01
MMQSLLSSPVHAVQQPSPQQQLPSPTFSNSGSSSFAAPSQSQTTASLLLGVDPTTGTVAVTSQLVQELVALQQRSHEQVCYTPPILHRQTVNTSVLAVCANRVCLTLCA